MKIRLTMILATGVFASMATPSFAQTGIFAQSYFTHDPDTGTRVPQYAENAPSIAPPGINYQISGYRYLQSNIRGAGGGVDRQLFVEQWGNGRGLRDAQTERDFQAFQQPFRGRTPDGRAYSLPGYGWPGYNYPLVPMINNGFGGGFPFFPQGVGPGFGGPGFGGPGYGGPGYGKPGFDKPGFDKPGHGHPGHGDKPGHGHPGYGDKPGHGHPGYGGKPGHGHPGYGDKPGHGHAG